MLNKRFVWNFEIAVYTVNSAYLILIIKRKISTLTSFQNALKSRTIFLCTKIKLES